MKTVYNLFFLSVTALFLISPTISSSQNLVPNFGFEVQDTCPDVSQLELAPPWDSPTLGTPDLFNSSCGFQNIPGRTGIGCSGVFCYNNFPNNREYIQAPLTSPLVAGQTYCVSFYVKRLNYRYAINRIGAYFSVGPENQTSTSVLNVYPQVENNQGNMLSSTGWTEISGSFVANGNEDHIIIGNFSDDDDTDTLVVNASNAYTVAFYLIDDIIVEACGSNSVFTIADAEKGITLFPSPAYDLINLSLPSNLNISTASLVDLSGRVVMQIPINETLIEKIIIDISTIPEGIYMVSIHTSLGRVNKRVVIAR